MSPVPVARSVVRRVVVAPKRVVARLELTPGGRWRVVGALIAFALTGNTSRAEWELVGAAEGVGAESRVERLKEEAEAALVEIRQVLPERFGLSLRGALRIRWQLDLSPLPAPAQPTSDDAARALPFEEGRTTFDDRGIRVVLAARRFLSRPKRVRMVVFHEAVHAATAMNLGSKPRYLALPRWLREGLAVMGAGAVDRVIDERLAYEAFASRPLGSFLAGANLGHDPRTVTYAESALAVRDMEKRLRAVVGAEPWRLFLREVRAGHSPTQVWLEITGQSAAALEVELRASARVELRRRLPRASELEFQRSLRLRRQGALEAAAAVWDALLQPESVKHHACLHSTLDYLLAKEAFRSQGARAAIGSRLDRLLRDPVAGRPAPKLWLPETLLLKGEWLRARSRQAEAAKVLRDVCEAYPEDGSVTARARRLLGALERR